MIESRQLAALALTLYLRLRYRVRAVARHTRATPPYWHVRVTATGRGPDGSRLRGEGSLSTTGTRLAARLSCLLAAQLRRTVDAYAADPDGIAQRISERMERMRAEHPEVHITGGMETP